MRKILVKHPTGIVKGLIDLKGSKSISNRVLIIRSLCDKDFKIENLSPSDDTLVLLKALRFQQNEIDVHHAGTSMRFLTALTATKAGEWILSGSERMHQRPIGVLVNALKALGADISYLKNEGYPPLSINGKLLEGGLVNVSGNISSQFISALLLIAPTLETGMILTIDGELVSKPYIEMTLSIMEEFGVDYVWEGETIVIPPKEYIADDYFVESDWSGASYLLQMAGLSKSSRLMVSDLSSESLQGDSQSVKLFKELGVSCIYAGYTLVVDKEKTITEEDYQADCIECPDLAQTLVATCAGLKKNATFTGLQTLAIKETDRTQALANELQKVNCLFWGEGGDWYLNAEEFGTDEIPTFSTYNDHRMAMAFAPLALKLPQGVIIEDPDVVKKSYPTFWSDLNKLGFEISELEA
ncbi:UNVERIFIED_CONTAM: hypothetical protein GTU68_023205 [Idotea baltica]|nr:hypothetical protein [Idotea baltica]